MTDTPPYVFWPNDIGPYETDIYQLLTQLEHIELSAEARSAVRSQLELLPRYYKARLPYHKYRAYLLVLLDLLQQGWSHLCRNGRLYLSPPAWSEAASTPAAIQSQKEAIRQALSHERLAQIQKASVQRFILGMEKPRPYGCHVVSIRCLFADVHELTSSLESVKSLETEKLQREAIRSAIQPYLQLVSDKRRCSHTGFLLNDIWRYLRYTWSIPYNSTPGRNMFYLVRDAARPFHPVIGIAALGSSLVQITVRDDAIGWTPTATINRIMDQSFSEVQAVNFAASLNKTLIAAIDDIAIQDLINKADVSLPSTETLNILQQIEDDERTHRLSLLQQIQQLQSILKKQRAQVAKLENLEDLIEANTRIDELNATILSIKEHENLSLFRIKRAATLRMLLDARKTLQEFAGVLESVAGLRSFIGTTEGKRALRTLVRENKKRKVGINMMDIIICGALPPYSALLGGKLVAMLMCSPQVIKNYKDKYVGYTSHIASRMKQNDVFREQNLVFLGTTSLYHVGSSQYNRISIPVANTGERIKYERLGKTLGFGSVHFSQETVSAFKRLQELAKNARVVNYRFGEGVNPKLRTVSAGLQLIGLDNVEHFTKHRSQRIVYGISLGKWSFEYLRGETDDPGYYFNLESLEQIENSTQEIIDYWSDRWLLMRIKSPSVLEQVSCFNIDQVLLSSGSPINLQPEASEANNSR